MLPSAIVAVSERDASDRCITRWLDVDRLRSAGYDPIDKSISTFIINHPFGGWAPKSLSDCFLDCAMTACWHYMDGVCFYEADEGGAWQDDDGWRFIGYRWALCRADGEPTDEIIPLSPVKLRMERLLEEIKTATAFWIDRARRAGA